MDQVIDHYPNSIFVLFVHMKKIYFTNDEFAIFG
jgi:hypothetical protein